MGHIMNRATNQNTQHNIAQQMDKPDAHTKSLLTLDLLMFILVALFVIVGVILSGEAMATEEPEYTVTQQDKPFELRHYEPKIIAQVEVEGSMDKASNKGFRLLADYIFGNNTVVSGSNPKAEKISMTAPVTMASQTATANAEKIDMTAPVTVAQSDDTWRVNFVMPSKYTLETLPKPNNPAVTLHQQPGQQFAVIRFSGLTGAKKVDAKTNDLLAWMAEHNLTPTGEPQLARYNGPWTLPMLRRNEVMIAYKKL